MGRNNALDALRAFCMLLGILMHAMVSYAHGCPDYWLIPDNYRNGFFDFLLFIMHAFRMETFFLMSGFFSLLLYQRKGLSQFTQNRIRRIVLPFIGLFPVMLFLIPLIINAPATKYVFKGLPLMHLWFLYYLMIFYSIFIMLIKSNEQTPGLTLKLFEKIDAHFLAFLQTKKNLLILPLLTLPFLLQMKSYTVDTPLYFKAPIHLLVYYGIFFAFGTLLGRQPTLLNTLVKNRGFYLKMCIPLIIFAIFCTSMLRSISMTTPSLSLSELNFLSFNHPFILIATRILYAICTWFLVFGILGFFTHHFVKENRVIISLSKASYGMYLFHLPVILFLQSQLSDSSIPGFIKPFVIFAITFFGLWLMMGKDLRSWGKTYLIRKSI